MSDEIARINAAMKAITEAYSGYDWRPPLGLAKRYVRPDTSVEMVERLHEIRRPGLAPARIR